MRLLAVFLMALLSACASAPTVVYTLTSVPSARATVSGPPVVPPIEVGDVMIPGVIDREPVIVAAPNGQVDISGTAVWGSPLQEVIRRTLSADLASRLPPGSVLAPGDPAPPGGVRILLVNIQKFWGDTAGQVGLVADWSVTRGGNPTGEPQHAVIDISAGSGDVSAIVPAMSRALGALADQIAATLR